MSSSPQEETKSGFLLRNLLKGLVWFAVIITAYILLQSEIEVYEHEIARLGNKLGLLLSIFTVSEIVFGIIPPEVFMFIWRGGEVSQYVLNLALLTVISYGAGVLGYYLGYTFSKTPIYKRIHQRYLAQYDRQLRKYGGYLVLVGAITPVPFSATCMMAGSVRLGFKNFLLICISRILRFAFYGWMVWQFPSWFVA